MKYSWQIAVFILFVLILIGIQTLYWEGSLSLSYIIETKDEFLRLARDYSVLAAIIYIALFVLSIIFGIPISATLIGGYLFGVWLGILYSMLAIIIGTSLLCSFTHYILGDWLQARYKDELKPFNKEIEKYGLHYIIMIHSIPFMPSFLPNVALSLSKISLWKVIGLNILGAFPLTCLYVVSGSYIHNVDSWHALVLFVTVVAAILGLLLSGIVLYRRLIV